MKIILALSWYFPEHLGGTEVYVAGLAQRLRQAGYDIIIAAPQAGLTEERNYNHEGIPVYRYPIPLKPTRQECQGRATVRGTERLHEWMKIQKPDWIHIHSFSTGLGLAEVRAARTVGARVIVTNHLGSLGFVCQRGTLMRWGEQLCDGICEPVKCAACELQHRGMGKVGASILARATSFFPIPEISGPIGSALAMPDLIRRNLETQREVLDLVDWFVVLNQWAVNALVANGAPPSKVRLNYLGVSNKAQLASMKSRTRSAGSPIKIGYFGRIVELKGVVELAKAFARLPRDLQVELEFRGPSSSPQDQRLIGQLKEIVRNDERVTFCPAVAPQDAPRILAGYDVLCIPSVWFENGPTVMLEAHAVGTPVLGTRIGAMAEIIVDGVNGRLVPPKDIAALTAALQEIVLNPEGTLDVWRAAMVEPRTMDDIAVDYQKLYAAD